MQDNEGEKPRRIHIEFIETGPVEIPVHVVPDGPEHHDVHNRLFGGRGGAQGTFDPSVN